MLAQAGRLASPLHRQVAATFATATTLGLGRPPFSTAAPAQPPPPPPPPGPLAGYKVLDLGQVVAGNFAGALFAYFGADVIKVEPPGGDPLRSLRVLDGSGTSLWWRTYGRNRRCLVADLRTEAGRGVVRDLATRSDVLIENFTPGKMEGWGLGPAELDPALVYCRISGYGQTGPLAGRPGYASVCEAHSGFRAVNGFPDRAPVRPNISLGDSLAGLHAAFGGVMALLARDRGPTGVGRVPNPAASASPPVGQVVDAAITESVFSMLEACVPEWVEAGTDREPSGSTISGVVPSATFRTADARWCVVGGNGDSVYTRLMGVVGRPDMGAANPAFADNAARCSRADEIYGVITAWVAARPLAAVLEAMAAARVPAGPILRPRDLVDDPQFVERGMFQAAPPAPGGAQAPAQAPAGGGGGEAAPGPPRPVTVPAMLPVLGRTPGGTAWAGPELGQHTAEVLRGELGWGEAAVAAYVASVQGGK